MPASQAKIWLGVCNIFAEEVYSSPIDPDFNDYSEMIFVKSIWKSTNDAEVAWQLYREEYKRLTNLA